jgi:hypothetical protein
MTDELERRRRGEEEGEGEEMEQHTRCSGQIKKQVPLEHQPGELPLQKNSSTQYLIPRNEACVPHPFSIDGPHSTIKKIR